ncbi:DUF2000 domain-containing protein, partial [Arhodomonas sp. KWT]|uniref:DUF2000 domain-containing protein n=1 Tax=Arhodomonas sp. KWT TaxID=2679915 RepID=UPI0013D30B50
MSTKSVIIVDGSLPTGLKANTAAVLAFSLGKACPELVGPPVRCVDGTELPGITTTPLPILESASPALAALHGEAAAGGLTVFCFTGT